MPDRDARKGANEARSRMVNEEMVAAEERIFAFVPMLEVLCECADADCTSLISVSREEYERVRQEPTDFIVAHGHVDGSVELIVDDCPRFVVVRKRQGDAATIARNTDPRE